MIQKIDAIRENKIKCKKCGDIIESKSRHDFVWCSCKSVAVDGGHDYLRRTGNLEDFEELSRTVKLAKIITDGFEKVPNAISMNDYNDENYYCPKCKSNYISLELNSGIKNDLIAIACHDCEKIFYFDDIE